MEADQHFKQTSSNHPAAVSCVIDKKSLARDI